MWTNLGKAFIAALVVVIIADLMAKGVVGRVEFAHSYDEARNPQYRRAWPAFTEPRPRAPGEKLVILISNSQGAAHELEDEQCYAHLLETRLIQEESGGSVIVANWSLGGASGPEMLLFAARAIDHDPDLLMLVTHSNPFSHHRLNNPLSFYLSDAEQLAYQQPIRDRLPGWFLRQHDVYDPAAYLAAHSGLVQCRNTFVEQRHRRWQLANHTSAPRVRKPRLFGAPEVRATGDRLLKACIDTFQKGRPHTPILMVSMPICRPRWNAPSWPRLKEFGQRMQALAEQTPGVTAIDAIEIIDDELFLTHTHMSEQGHIVFTDYLLPYVKDQLVLSPHPTSDQP